MRIFHHSNNGTSVLGKYFADMQSKCTSNNALKFVSGRVRMYLLVTDVINRGIVIAICHNHNTARAPIIECFFLGEMRFSNICLPRLPIKYLGSNRIKRFSKNYGTIPEKYLEYYLDVDNTKSEDSAD